MSLLPALIGLLVGFLVGISGVGGSSLGTPLIILLLRVHPLVAIGTDLAYNVPTKLLGAYVHCKEGTVDWQIVLFLALGGVPAMVAGLVVLTILRAYLGLEYLNAFLKHSIGVLLFIVAVSIVLTPLLLQGRGRAIRDMQEWTTATKRRTVVLGVLVGFLVGLTSLGSGSIAVPVLYALMPGLTLRRNVGSNVAFAALLIPAAALGQVGMGNVDAVLVANLLIGSLPGVYLGSKLCAHLPDTILRPALAGMLVFAGSRLL